jgi:hypothetical protein
MAQALEGMVGMDMRVYQQQRIILLQGRDGDIVICVASTSRPMQCIVQNVMFVSKDMTITALGWVSGTCVLTILSPLTSLVVVSKVCIN